MLDPDFYRWMDELSREPPFAATVLLSDQKEDEGYRQELVLRFFLHRTFTGGDVELRKELGDFITDWARESAVNVRSDQRALWSLNFRETFAVLEEALGDDTFKRYDETKNKFLGPFSISAFEAITSGVASHLADWRDLGPGPLIDRVRDMWVTPSYRENSGAGITPRRRTPKLVNFGREFFRP
jgi:hypothetical protein